MLTENDTFPGITLQIISAKHCDVGRPYVILYQFAFLRIKRTAVFQ